MDGAQEIFGGVQFFPGLKPVSRCWLYAGVETPAFPDEFLCGVFSPDLLVLAFQSAWKQPQVLRLSFGSFRMTVKVRRSRILLCHEVLSVASRIRVLLDEGEAMRLRGPKLVP